MDIILPEVRNYHPNTLYVAKSAIEGAGKGVFTHQFIAARCLIERCEIKMVEYSGSLTEEELRALNCRTYAFGEGRAETNGFGLQYNHSYRPNAEYTKLPEIGLIEFRAIQDIYSRGEITVNYNMNPRDMSPVGMGIPIPATL